MVEVMELNMEGEDYAIKGHNLTKEEIEKAIKEQRGDDVKINAKYETWCHWCYGYWDGEKQRYCLFDNKYKGVRGGFPITVIEDVEYLN